MVILLRSSIYIYIKLRNTNKELSIRLLVYHNAFREFYKAVHVEVNVIITTYNALSKCIGDIHIEY